MFACCGVRSRGTETSARVRTRSSRGGPCSSSRWSHDRIFGTGTASCCRRWPYAYVSSISCTPRNWACRPFPVDTCRSCSVQTATPRGALKHGDEDAEGHARVRARKKSFYDDHRPFGLGCIIGFSSKQRIMKMIKSERRSSQRDLARTQHFRLRLHAS